MGVHYIHILFDGHEIMDVDGALVESLLIAGQSRRLIDDLDILINPSDAKKRPMAPARPLAEGKRGKTLIARLPKHQKPFVTEASERFDLLRAG